MYNSETSIMLSTLYLINVTFWKDSSALIVYTISCHDTKKYFHY